MNNNNRLPKPNTGYINLNELGIRKQKIDINFPMSRFGDYISESPSAQLANRFCSYGGQHAIQAVQLNNDKPGTINDTELLIGYDKDIKPVRVALLIRTDLNAGNWNCFYLPDYLAPETTYLKRKEILITKYAKIISKEQHIYGYAYGEIPVSISIWCFNDTLLHVILNVGNILYEIYTDNPITNYIKKSRKADILKEFLLTEIDHQ